MSKINKTVHEFINTLRLAEPTVLNCDVHLIYLNVA